MVQKRRGLRAGCQTTLALSIALATVVMISMTRVVRNEEGRPVELIQALYRPDKYEYRVNLSRNKGSDAPRWTVT